MTEQQFSPLYHTHKSQHTAEEILAYWTPERLAAAQPHDEGHPADENRSWLAARPASPAFEESGTLTYESSKVPNAKLYEYPYHSVGKLFFTLDGQEHTGSAAVVDRNGLITAAHNLYNREKKMWVNNVIFYPAYTNGHENAKYGIWTARERAVVEPWIEGKTQKEADPFDVGFIKLNPRKQLPAQIGKVVGPLPLLVGMEPTEDTSWLTLGYPRSDYNLNGKDMWQCKGPWFYTGKGVITKEGNFTYGASGGPWLFEQDSSYKINAVTSAKVPDLNLNTASYFGAWVEKFFHNYFG